MWNFLWRFARVATTIGRRFHLSTTRAISLPLRHAGEHFIGRASIEERWKGCWSIGAQFGAQLPFQLFPGNWPLPAANIRLRIFKENAMAVMPNLSFHGIEEIGNQLEQCGHWLHAHARPLNKLFYTRVNTPFVPLIIHRPVSIFPIKFRSLSAEGIDWNKFHRVYSSRSNGKLSRD